MNNEDLKVKSEFVQEENSTSPFDKLDLGSSDELKDEVVTQDGAGTIVGGPKEVILDDFIETSNSDNDLKNFFESEFTNHELKDNFEDIEPGIYEVEVLEHGFFKNDNGFMKFFLKMVTTEKEGQVNGWVLSQDAIIDYGNNKPNENKEIGKNILYGLIAKMGLNKNDVQSMEEFQSIFDEKIKGTVHNINVSYKKGETRNYQKIAIVK